MGLNISFPLYRVAHLVADLGWVDLDFECSTVCPIMSGLMGIWQKELSKWAKWWKAEIQVNPTQIRDHQGHRLALLLNNVISIGSTNDNEK